MIPSFPNLFKYLVHTILFLSVYTNNIFGQTGWQTGFVLHLKMDGNLTDNGPSGISFTNNGASLTTDRFGVANKAYSFAGSSSSYITSPSESFTHPSIYSYSFWIKYNTQSAESIPISFYNSTAPPENMKYLIFRLESGVKNLKLGTDELSGYEIGNSINESDILNTWKHIVITDDQSVVKFYLNGILKGSISTSHVTASGQGVAINLGRYLSGGGGYFPFIGSLDEIRVYNKVLTSSDVDGLYTAEKPTTATCGDGIQNQGETGIDCGGPCSAPCGSGGTSQWTTSGTAIYYANGVHIGKANTINTGEAGYSLFVKNGIKTEKIKVELPSTGGWADYVFYPDYKQMPIRDLEKFIKTNKHLPGYPSVKTILKDGGYEITDMIKRQQVSIENLHLYIIELKREIEALKNKK